MKKGDSAVSLFQHHLHPVEILSTLTDEDRGRKRCRAVGIGRGVETLGGEVADERMAGDVTLALEEAEILTVEDKEPSAAIDD